MIQLLGDEFIIRRTGAEQESIGIEYPSGLCFTFSDNTMYLSDISCEDTVSFKGTHGGMKFNEIIEILGEGEYSYYNDEEVEYIWYKHVYIINGIRYTFLSRQEDGEDSRLVITKTLLN